MQCVGWWSRQNCFNFWIYVAIWAWNWICKGSAAWLKKHWVHTSTAMLLFWAAKKHHVMDVTYFKSCIFSQKKTLIYFQTYSKVSTSKGQIISKGLLVSSNSPKNEWRNSFLLQQWIHLFVVFWGENSRTPESPFEIVWPLRMAYT